MPEPALAAPSPEALGRVLVRLLPRLIRALVAEMHRAPLAGDLSLPQFRVLCYLSERDYRAAELAATLEIGRSTLTTIVDGLVRRGLVARLRDLPDDRRGVLLRLTPAGSAVQRALEAHAVARAAALLAAASPGERAGLAAGLAALERALADAARPRTPQTEEG